ncbi:MAG: Asp-tRNA(Asn)/Glu-tRNA(Gln) amidotransferase subunit GatA [Verrucomicrobiota bacterium]|nr:Asp-tRNA(Asn)/Glu-tRNA(Gln) amidotransferase subunit GatA [Verrucomicrobiota bacterium]
MNFYRLSAREIRDLFIAGEATAVSIAEHFLARIAKHDPSLGAFLEVFTEETLLQAEALDRKRKRGDKLGRLAAVPVAIKDNMHIARQITTCASRFLQNYRAPFDSTVVRLMAAEDALFVGKTNLDEFAMGSSTENSAFFSTSNPWNLETVPGGSSGGSAAAVAARLCPIATGSDTGGSIRQPASLCGVVGFKPTYGRVSRYGLVAFGSSLDQIGPITTNVSDAALAMEIIGHPCSCDATCLELPPEQYMLKKEIGKIRLGVPSSFLEKMNDEVKANFFASVDILRKLGAEVIEVDLKILTNSIPVYYILSTAEASTNLARFDGIRYGERSSAAKTLEEIYDFSRKEGFGAEVKQRILLGTYVLSAGFQDAYYRKAQKVRTLIIQAFENAFSSCDLVLFPTASSGAFRKGAIHDPLEMYLQDLFTVPANLAGLPALSLPSGFTKDGLPLGLQIVGPQLADVSVMQVGYAYEQATSNTKVPPLFEEGAS